MTLTERFGTPFLVIAITAGAMFAVLVAGGSGMLENWLYRIVYDAAAIVAIVAWLVVAASRRDWLPSSRLTPAIAACLAAFAVATVTSRVPRLSVEMLGYAILLAELYLLLVALMRRPKLRVHFERLALVLCLLVCALYLLQVFQAWQLWWGVVGHLTIPPLRPAYEGLSLGSPNPIATLVLLLGAFTLATGRLSGRVARVRSTVLLAFVALATLISGSRGAWIGAGAALVVCALISAAAVPAMRTRALRFVRTRAGAATVLLCFAALVAGGALAASSGRLTLDDGGAREAFSAASLRMFQSSPLLGVGPGVWQVLRASYTTASQPDIYIPHAHNVYLQTLAEFGVAGVIAGVVGVAEIAALILGAIRSGNSSRQRVGLAALFAVILLAGQQLADMLMNVPALLLAMAIPLAWLDATAPERDPEPRPAAGPRDRSRGMWPRVLVFGMLALTVVVAAGLIRIEAITWGALRGVAAANAGDWEGAVWSAENAAHTDPSVTSYWFEMGVVAANAGDLPSAADALGRSANADDYTYAWLDLAAVRWRLGDAAGARSALARAERLGLQRMPVAVAAGWLRWQLGDRTGAISDYAVAIVTDPTLAADPFWNSNPELSSAKPAILDAARQLIDGGMAVTADEAPSLFQLQLLTGDANAAVAELAPLSAVDRAFYDRVVAAWQGKPGSETELQQVAQRHPLDSTPASWCQLVAAHHNESALVAKYGAWLADGFEAGPPIARVILGQPQLLVGSVVDRYGSLYRRPVPADQVVRILPQIVYQDHF